MKTVQELELYSIQNGTFDQGLAYMQSRQERQRKGRENLSDPLSKKTLRQLHRYGIVTYQDLWNTSKNQRDGMFWLSRKAKEEIEKLLSL
jgi:hypothetical protein